MTKLKYLKHTLFEELLLEELIVDILIIRYLTQRTVFLIYFSF